MKNIQNNFISGIGNTPLFKLRAASEMFNVIFMEKQNILILVDQLKIEQP